MAAVDEEPNSHKFRLCTYAVLMIGISTTYQAFFDNISFRAGQLQNIALAGDAEFIDYIDPLERWVWSLRKDLAVLEKLSAKDLKYLEEGEPEIFEGEWSRDEGLVSREFPENEYL